jgi:ketosteroid isomerase-like protein
MKHANALLLEKIYADYSKGDYQAMLAHCAPNITFQVPGKSRLAGKFTAANFAEGIALKMLELSNQTFKFEAHDILASDLHGAVLGTEKLERDGKTIEARAVHIWRFEGGKPVAWYEYSRDLYQFDAIWY